MKQPWINNILKLKAIYRTYFMIKFQQLFVKKQFKRNQINESSKQLVILTFLMCVLLPNNVYCGTLEEVNSTINLQELVRDFFAEMDAVEIDEFGRELVRRHGPRELDPPQNWPENINTEISNRSIWTPMIFYVLLSATIILVSLYHQEIINTVYNVTQDIFKEFIPSAINGLLPKNVVRQATETLLQDPEKQEQIRIMMEQMRIARQFTRGG